MELGERVDLLIPSVRSDLNDAQQRIPVNRNRLAMQGRQTDAH